MKVLGEESVSSHRGLGEMAATSGADALFLFGDEMADAYGRIADTAPMPVVWTADFQSLSDDIVRFLREGDLVLVKGSRGVELERLLPVILASPAIPGKGGPGC